jgi:hypothetical protein
MFYSEQSPLSLKLSFTLSGVLYPLPKTVMSTEHKWKVWHRPAPYETKPWIEAFSDDPGIIADQVYIIFEL